MGKIKYWLLSLIMILVGSTFLLTGCDEYRKLSVTLSQSEVTVFLSDNPEENIFEISATVSGNKKGVSTNVIFEILSTQGIIEAYGNPTKDGNTTTAKYLALSKGKVQINVVTEEGNKSALCTVNVEEPLKDITFTKDELALNRGAEKDLSEFIKFNPTNTSQTNIELSVLNADVDELDKIHINGTKVLVDSDSSITNFTLQVKSLDNEEIIKTISVDVVDTINQLKIEYTDSSLPGFVEVEKVDGVYTLNLAQNVNDEALYKKLIKLKGFIQSGEDLIDKGYITADSDYQIKLLSLNTETNEFEPIELPYNGEYFEISKQFSDGSFQILQRRKGSETLKLVVDYANHVGEFTTEIVLKVNVLGLPTKIDVLYSNESVDEITLYDRTTGTVEGTSINLNVVGVNEEILNDEPVLITFESESEVKVSVYNKYGVELDIANPITITNDCPLLISHNYASDEQAPTDLKMVFTSVNYEKIYKKVDVNFIRGEIVLGILSEIRIPYDATNKEVEIVGLIAGFDKSLLKVYIADESIVKVDKTILLKENKIVLVPQGKFGKTTFYIVAPNGVKSRTCTVTVFEELKDESTIKIYGTTIKPYSVDQSNHTIILKTSGTYNIKYNINNIHDNLITGMTSSISVVEQNTQRIVNIVDGTIKTLSKTGTASITVTITGYNENGELTKTLEYKFDIEVRAPLISATPNIYVASIYNLSKVVGYEETLAKQKIIFRVNPSTASFTKDDMNWIIKIGNEIIQPLNIVENTSGDITTTTYIFEYNNNVVYIETTSDNLQQAVVYAVLTSESMVFNAICQISQTFPNENGVLITTVNEDVNVTFTVSQPVKVSSIILDNVKKTSVSNGEVSEVKNSYTFDTREMTIDSTGKFTSGNVYVVKYTILPANATIKEITATHTQAQSDLELSVDNENQTITIKVNRQINGETIIYIRAKDSVDEIVEQQIYLKVANGTINNEFEIENADDMLKISNSLNSHYILTADINLQSITNFEPIGTKDTPFTGSINGVHKIVLGDSVVDVQHTIYNLNITRRQSDETGNINYFGLFGYVGETGALLNLQLNGVNINILDSNSNQVVYVGALAGFSKGLIYNCSVVDGSQVQTSSATSMFTDATKPVGITYRALASNKTTYVGGLVGMLVGIVDLTENFKNAIDLVDGITTNFENNNAYVNIVATSTIETSAIIAGGLVGYNLGAHILNSEKTDYNVVSSINTLPNTSMSNQNSIYGGLVGINLGGIENYTTKSYVKGLTYTGGLVGINMGQLVNNTVLPVVRGKTYVGGLVGYNIYNDNLEINTISSYLLPNVYLLDSNEIAEEYKISSNLYENLFSKSNSKVYVNATHDVVNKTYNLLENELYNAVYGNKVQFIDNAEKTSVYNTGIIGETYVGGLIGYNNQYANKEETTYYTTYNIAEALFGNSVYSYFNVGITSGSRRIYNYNENDTLNHYFGDIISLNSSSNSVGGLIGGANNANIVKGFVNANIATSAPSDVKMNVGGIIGTIGTSKNGILRIVDSHANGVVNSVSGIDNIGAFIGDASNIYEAKFENNNIINPRYNNLKNGSGSLNFYNIESSYSVLSKSLGTVNYVSTTSFVDCFSGIDTTVDTTITVDGQTFDLTYDNLTTINSFYIGFTIKYLQNSTGGIDHSTQLGSADINNITTLTFNYADALNGYTLLNDGSKFYYFNQEFDEIVGRTVFYSNFRVGEFAKEIGKIQVEGGEVDGTVAIDFVNVQNVAVGSDYTYKIYYVETENEDEDGFGANSETLEISNGSIINVINKNYNWYQNIYEYENKSNPGTKYKAYNGLPLILNLKNVYRVTNPQTVEYDDSINLVIDLPPMGIDVTFNGNNNTSFVHDILVNGNVEKEIILTFTELDSKYYNSDGTINSFNNQTEFDKINYSLDIKNSIIKENTYKLKDVIDISALPKFVGVSKLEYYSVNGLIKFGYDSNGNETLQVLGAGQDQIVITSKYNKEVTYTANVNIISKISNLQLLKNKRSTTEITSLDIVKNVETSFYADINSTYSKILNSTNYVFDLVQRQNLGVRYYFTTFVNGSLSIYHDNNSSTWDFALNGIKDIVCEEVQVEVVNDGVVTTETRYLYYVDISSSEISILGNIAFNEYSTLLAVPYIALSSENFFIVSVNDIEEIANSYVKNSSGLAGTFTKSNDLIKPLQIKVYNETFNLKVDKTSVEFSAYTQPILTVTLDTDNFDEDLYFVISNGTNETAESSAETSKIVTLDNLQVLSFAPQSNVDDREKIYKFELSVIKVNNIYTTITDDNHLTITFYTKENGNIKFVKSCDVTLLPQPINEISVLHYPSSEYEEVEVNGEIVFVPKTNEVAYNNIIPGYMGLLKINLSPYYGNVTSVNVTSSTVDGKTINFEQLVYYEDGDNFNYQTAYPQAERITDGIIALPRSTTDLNYNYLYDGNLYIRTILPTNTLSGSIFTVTITVYAYVNGNLISYPAKTIELEAITPPGLYLSYKNSSYGVVARGTDNIFTLTGDGLENAFIDFNEYTTVNIYNGGTEYGVNGRVRVSKNNDGTYTLSVASDLPQGSTINLVAYTEKTINDRIYTSQAKLTLKVADFVVESITVENVVDGVYQSILNQSKMLKVALKDVSYNPYIPQINNKLRDFADSISKKLNSNNANSTWYQRIYNTDGSFNDVNLVDKDYGTFVIRTDSDGSMYLRNTVKNTSDVLVAKAIINYGFGSSSDITLIDPNSTTMPDSVMDDSFIVELECEFTFNVQRNTNDETPEPISTTEQFLNMEAGINYILLEDIVLTNYKPISTEIASLDGNGYIITIKSFDTSVETNEEGEVTGDTTNINIGLFDTVAEGTTLKNITVEIVPLGTLHNVVEESNNTTQDLLIDATAYNNVNFGFIAGQNDGVITNAQVVNDVLANEIRAEREKLLQESLGDNKVTGEPNYVARTYSNVEGRSISVVKVTAKADVSNARIAGLVAINNGYITNSRVENVTINGVGYVAGLVVQNNQTISSSYYKGANLLNQSSDLIENAGTAGLVVFNESGATIQYCYTMSREGWTYNYNENSLDEENNLANGSIVWDNSSIFTKDITGISTVEKNLFTGVYNENTLTISDNNGIVTKSNNLEFTNIYEAAINALRNNSDIATLRAVNSGINVDTDASGFVYQNNGTISNSYSNMLVNAAHSAGFVFTSGENGLIEDCYSLSSVRIENDAHSPFTGKTVNDVENSYNATTSNISYSHYLKIDQTLKFTYNKTGSVGDDGYDKLQEETYTITLLDRFYDTNEPATSLEAEEFYSYNSFQGYAFNTDFELNTDILRSVWFIPSKITAESYDTYNVITKNFKHSYYAPSRPELVSANLRTLSVRYLTSDYESSETLSYEYVNGLIIGESIRNPYLVYNATTFNDYGTLAYKNSNGQENVNRNYLRFVSNITFEGTSVTDIKAETYNIDFAGDIDGNGMYINDLKLIAESQIETSQTITHLGLFGKLYETQNDDGSKFSAIVRNLNINVTSIDGTGVMYVGALAGEMINASAYNIRIYGEGVYVNGQNAVGGGVGKISGDSELVNVSTNISVSATNKSTTVGSPNFNAYDGTEETLKGISYAGGIAGIVDVNDRGEDVKTAQKYARLRKIDVYGNTTISGDIVGGIFGYVGATSNISDSHFTITTSNDSNPRLVSKYSAGGLVGELRGKIERSYITHENQSVINDEIKTNINKTTHNSTGSTKIYNKLFNSSALAQSYYIGGIAGINLGGTISDSYSNVNVINGVSSYAGGVVGLNAGGTIKSVYTTGSVYAKQVGGFIGLVVNGSWLKDGLIQESGGNIYIGVETLKEEGFIINNIKDLLSQITFGSLILNSAVSANVWRSEDLSNLNYDNIGSFVGKFIDNINVTTKIISTSSDSAREMAEQNIFTNATVFNKISNAQREIQEIGAINSGAGYSVTEYVYETNLVPQSTIKYVNGRHGVIYKEENKTYYYYSRLKTYGSLRTIEEIINRNISYEISMLYEAPKNNGNASSSNFGDYYIYNQNAGYTLPKIYKGWSSIYWEGTALNNAGVPDSTHVFPSLIARPNVAVVRVYDSQDLQLIYTLLSSEFILMNDIELEDTWTPVGTETDPFTGSIHSDFDSSNNYNSWTIKNVSITVNEGNGAGFFGTISGAKIHDFNINISKLQIDKSTEYELNVGGLVGNSLNEDLSQVYNVMVIGGSQISAKDANGIYKNDETVVGGIGTSGSYFRGTSVITATNISTLGGVVGSATNIEISNVSAINLNISAFNNLDAANKTDAGANKQEDGDFNAIGGVVGYYKRNDDTVTTLSDLVSQNVKIGNNEVSNYNETLYIGGAVGIADSVYLRNVKVTDFSMDGTYAYKDNIEKEIYVGGVTGYLNGIAFNTSIVNKESKNINITLTSKVSVYVGGAYGNLSGLLSNYSESPDLIGGSPVRSDNNPFAKVDGQTSYNIQNISNSIIADVAITVRVNNTNANSYIGGVIGNSSSKLYNLVSYGTLDVHADNNAYVAGLIGNATNNYVKNGYSNRNIKLSNNTTNDNNTTAYLSGGIGKVSNAQISNLVSYGEVSVESNHRTAYVAGLIGYGVNVSQTTSISNANLDVKSLNTNSNATMYVAGFIGKYEQTNGGGTNIVSAYIKNSYSTGTISINTTNYQKGGLGGFVGAISTATTNTVVNENSNSSSITNCYTVSRIVTDVSSIYYDNETKGGFVGKYEQNTNDILVNCYFNKELFNAYENSTNELILKRYVDNTPIMRDYGVGLTLDEMLYSVANKEGEQFTSVIAKAFQNEIAQNVNGKIISSDTSNIKVSVWRFENNKYPLIQFVFEAFIETITDANDTTKEIENAIYYNYVPTYFDNADNAKYNIQTLLSGSDVYDFAKLNEDGNYKNGQVFDNNGIDLNGRELEIVYNKQLFNENTLNSVQHIGSVQNPKVLSDVSINLSTNSNGVYTNDFTNKAVIITNATTEIIGTYGANNKVLENATILFKDVENATYSFGINEIDKYSLIYGMNGSSSVNNFNKNNGTIKNITLTITADNFVSQNIDGIIEDVNLTANSKLTAISRNEGIVDTFEYTVNNSSSNSIFNMVTTNTGTLNYITLNFNDSYSTSFNGNYVNINGAKNSVVNYKFTNMSLNDSTQKYAEVYKYYDAYGNLLTIYQNDISSLTLQGTSVNLPFYNESVQSVDKTFITFTKSNNKNTRAHAIDVFGDVGNNLKTNRFTTINTPYDFTNDWVILTGYNNNMPILRNNLKENYYDEDIDLEYYWKNDAQNAILDTDYKLSQSGSIYNYDILTAKGLAYVGNVISKATSGTYNVNITSQIDLKGKLWTPITVSVNVTVNLRGVGVDDNDNIDVDDLTKDRRIQNLSVLTTNSDAGFFGSVYGSVSVSNLLFEYGYVANVNDYIVDKSNSIVNNVYYDIDNTYGVGIYRNFASGAVVGSLYKSSATVSAVGLNRVGNQYVYVSGSNGQFYVSGLIGLNKQGQVGIKDSYVNSPFMINSRSAGLIYTNPNCNVYVSNTYAVNYDIYGNTDNKTYLANAISNKLATSGRTSLLGQTYNATTYNYYLNSTETVDTAKALNGTTSIKLKTGVLPQFDWTLNWTRLQGVNDGLPYNLTTIEYWINSGASAQSGVDYTISGSTYNVITSKGLAYIAYKVDDGETFSGKTIRLTSSTYDLSGKVWTPIGALDRPFKGEFTSTIGGSIIKFMNVSSYYSKKDGLNISADNIGLFGYVEDAKISKVIVQGSIITGSSQVGAIVGHAKNSTISNVKVINIPTTNEQTYVNGITNVGGLIGKLENTSSSTRRDSIIANSQNYALVYGTSNVGGIVGGNYNSVVELCENLGAVTGEKNQSTNPIYIGGIVGYSTGSIYEVVNRAEVRAYSDLVKSSNNVGGIVGRLTNNAGNQLINAINYANVYGVANVGLICGYADSVSSHNVVMAYSSASKYISNSPSSNNKYIGNVSTTSDLYGEKISTTSGLLTSNTFWGVETVNGNKVGTFTPKDASDYYQTSMDYTITSSNQLAYVMNLMNRRAYYKYEGGKDKFNLSLTNLTFEYTNNNTNYNDAYSFQGTIASSVSGTQRTINVTANSYGGLFHILKNSVVKDISINLVSVNNIDKEYFGVVAGKSYDVEITNVKINTNKFVSASGSYIGGLIGYGNNTEISNCAVVSTYISGGDYVGGFVGKLDGNSFITSTNASTYCANIDVKGLEYVGGIVGYGNAQISNINYYGDIYGSTYVGGIVGCNAGTVQNCISYSSIECTNRYLGGIVGYNTGTVSGSTYASEYELKGYSYIGGIAGYNSGTISGNTMNGNIYIYRADDDNGKKNYHINNFGFGYSMYYNDSASSKFTFNDGSSIYLGKVRFSDYIDDNYIYFIVGNSQDCGNNTIKSSSKINLEDNYVYYSLSHSSDKFDSGYQFPAGSWFTTGVHATISATSYKSTFYTYANQYEQREVSDGNYTKSITKDISKTWKNAWDFGAKDVKGLVNDIKNSLEAEYFDFTGTW